MTRVYSGNPIQVIQGGQYGSEAKGAVAGYYAVRDHIDIAVRTGATNAGHTVYTRGNRFVMQQLPVGWVNPDTTLVIGPGALVDPEILQREINDILARTGEDIRKRLLVDYRAYLHWPQHARSSAEADRHRLIGATGKGCSEALISRLRLRGVEDFTIGTHASKLGIDLPITDTEQFINKAWDGGAKIQLEGTQGQLLDLVLGPYPYVTHKQTGVAQWLLEAGLSPSLPVEVIMVVRTYPIRVAGNSGPLPGEISWPILADRINRGRANYGMPPLVSPDAIRAFEDAVDRVAREFEMPEPRNDRHPSDQHMWEPWERVKYRDALSNLNARAMAEVDDNTRSELAKLFEMTTVTKKLRRVADLDFGALAQSARQIRPHRVVVTFLNYEFPHRWGIAGGGGCTAEEAKYLRAIALACEAPVQLVNRGPLPEHFEEV